MGIKLSIRMNFLCVAPLALAISVSVFATSANAQGSDDAALRQWIARLTDPDPAMRSEAELEILAIGEEALPQLKESLQDGNLEIHNRCRILIEKLQAQRKARLSKVFLDAADGDAVLEEFPAWASFSEFAGDQSVSTRKLFLKMCDEIPLVFNDYDLKVEQTGPALKHAALLVLVKPKHPSASVDVLLTAFLYLVDRTVSANDPSEKSRFSSVETLQGLNFISNADHAQYVRQSEFRSIIDAAVAKWVISQKDGPGVPDDMMFSLGYGTANPLLIDELFRNYGNFDKTGKLNFIDIVDRAVIGKKGAGVDRCIAWLEKALADKEVVVNSRLQKKPANKIEVTPRLLAESIIAAQFNKDVENKGPVKLSKIFGIYPRSGKGFLIVESEKERILLSEQLRVRMQRTETVK